MMALGLRSNLSAEVLHTHIEPSHSGELRGVLGKLSAEALDTLASSLQGLLCHWDVELLGDGSPTQESTSSHDLEVHGVALQILALLPAEILKAHAPTVIRLIDGDSVDNEELEDSKPDPSAALTGNSQSERVVCVAVLKALQRLPTEVTEAHVTVIVKQLKSSDAAVRHAAFETLSTLVPTALEPHAAAIVAAIEAPRVASDDGDSVDSEDYSNDRNAAEHWRAMRESARKVAQMLHPAAIAPTANGFVDKLLLTPKEKSDAAMWSLGNPVGNVPSEYVSAIVQRLEHLRNGQPDWRVRNTALRALQELPAKGLQAQPSSVLSMIVQHCSRHSSRQALHLLDKLPDTTLQAHIPAIARRLLDGLEGNPAQGSAYQSMHHDLVHYPTTLSTIRWLRQRLSLGTAYELKAVANAYDLERKVASYAEQLKQLEQLENSSSAAGARPPTEAARRARRQDALNSFLKSLSKLPPDALRAHGAAIVQHLAEPEQEDTCLAALAALGKLPHDALQMHSSVIVLQLDNNRVRVRKAVLATLAKLAPGDLTKHAAAIVTRLKDSNLEVRQQAVDVLALFEPAALEGLAPNFTIALDDRVESASESEYTVPSCEAVLKVLGKLPAEALAVHTPSIVRQLQQDDTDVHQAALATLAKLAPAELVNHAAAVVADLEDPRSEVREAALHTLDTLPAETLSTLPSKVPAAMFPAILKHLESPGQLSLVALQVLGKLDGGREHAPDSVAKLVASEWVVRRAAIAALGVLDPVALVPHAAAIVAKVEDPNWEVRATALQALRKLPAGVLLPQVPAIVKQVEEAHRASGASHFALAALRTLGMVPTELPTELAPACTAAIARYLHHEDADVRAAAWEARAKLLVRGK